MQHICLKLLHLWAAWQFKRIRLVIILKYALGRKYLKSQGTYFLLCFHSDHKQLPYTNFITAKKYFFVKSKREFGLGHFCIDILRVTYPLRPITKVHKVVFILLSLDAFLMRPPCKQQAWYLLETCLPPTTIYY